MSAFLCSDDHFRQLAAWLCGSDQSTLKHIAHRINQLGSGFDYVQADELASVVANILKAENVRSLAARYGDDDETGDEPLQVSLGLIEQMRTVEPGRIAKSLYCYDYQACETANYETTVAKRIVSLIERELVERLPGYSDGNWGKPAELGREPEIVSLMSLAR